MPTHVALLGDSVFDNAAYTGGEPDVAAHLRDVLGAASRVTLIAIDGTTTMDIGVQFGRVRTDVSHIVLSVGGNDALMNAGLLNAPARSTGEALDMFEAAVGMFEASHRHVLEALVDLGRPLLACTIYNGNLPASEASRARVALMMFNDAITRNALAVGADVLDLRAICTQPSDYANPIEPSGSGGRKIAEAIASALRDQHAKRTVLRGSP